MFIIVTSRVRYNVYGGRLSTDTANFATCLGKCKIFNVRMIEERVTSIWFYVVQSSETEIKYKTYKNKLTSVLRCYEKTYFSELLEKQKIL